MSTSTTTPSVAAAAAESAAPAGGEAGTHLDEVTGERVSKRSAGVRPPVADPLSELKKRQKQREKEAKKADKVRSSRLLDADGQAAAKPAAPAAAAKEDAGPAEDDLDPNQYYELRCRAINALRTLPDSQHTRTQPNPYPHKFHVTISLRKYVETYDAKLKNPGDRLDSELVAVAGRIHSMRASGANLRFYDIWAEGVHLQVMAAKQCVHRRPIALTPQGGRGPGDVCGGARHLPAW